MAKRLKLRENFQNHIPIRNDAVDDFDDYSFAFDFSDAQPPPNVRIRNQVLESIPNFPRNVSKKDPHMHWDYVLTSNELTPDRLFENIVRKRS